jgi:hypothetical protein
MRAARIRVRVAGVGDLSAERGREIRVDATTASRLGITTGAVVECVNPGGAPLRAWVAAIVAGNGGRAEMAGAAMRMLAVADGDEIELRAVHPGAL